jgi:Family of unknown function (DUF6159)
VEPWQGQTDEGPKEGRVRRGWRLTQVAWKLIREDPTMLVLALAAVFFSTAFSLLFAYLLATTAAHHSGVRTTLLAFAALYVATLTGVFFNVALACAASAAFDGERMGPREAIRMAWGKRRRLALWSLISTLVGMLLAEVANRLPGGARLVARLVGAAWGLATIFVVPILAMEGVSPMEALKRSAGLVKRRWGEGVSGRISISAWTVLATIPLVVLLAIGVALLRQHPGSGVILIGFSLIAMVAVLTAAAATQQVFAVALYRYAIDAPIGGFASSDLEYPFVADAAGRQRKSWILRIGGPILALLLLLIVIGIIIGPRHPQAGAKGYFHVDYPPSQAAGLGVGSPVVYQRRQVGYVVGVEVDGAEVQIEFRTDPRLRYIVEANPAYVDHLRGRAYVRIGGQAPQPPTPQL